MGQLLQRSMDEEEEEKENKGGWRSMVGRGKEEEERGEKEGERKKGRHYTDIEDEGMKIKQGGGGEEKKRKYCRTKGGRVGEDERKRGEEWRDLKGGH